MWHQWRSWRTWAVFLGLAGPVFVVADVSASLGWGLPRVMANGPLLGLLLFLAAVTAVMAWGAACSAAHFARRFAMPAAPLLLMVAAYALFKRNAWDWNAAGGVLALAVLPSGLGFRMGWTASGVSWRAAIVAGMVVGALGLSAVAKAQTEWAGLALMLVLSWPVAHAVSVCRYRPASKS